MSLVEMLKNSGLKPEKQGGRRALKGTYKAALAKVEVVEAGTNEYRQDRHLHFECKVVDVIEGAQSNSDFNEFKKNLALEGEDVTDKKKGPFFLINGLYSVGIDISYETEEELIANLQGQVGTDLYISAWAWKPEGNEDEIQMFSFMTEAKALQRAKKSENSPF